MKNILMDATAYAMAMKGDHEVISFLRQASLLGLSSVTVGELLSGFRAGDHERENRSALFAFLDSPRVHLFSVDENTAEYYNMIFNQLKNAGTPLPVNQIWVAAVAFQKGLAILARDRSYEPIRGLLLL